MRILFILLISTCLSINAEAQQNLVVIGQSNAQFLIDTQSLEGNIIDCAHIGQPIAMFKLDLDKRKFFGDCINKIKATPGEISAIIFWQGESDAVNNILSARWSGEASRVLNDLVSCIGYQVPIIMVQLHNHRSDARKPYWDRIRKAQANFINVILIDSSQYTTTPDQSHFSTATYKDIGIKIETSINNEQ